MNRCTFHTYFMPLMLHLEVVWTSATTPTPRPQTRAPHPLSPFCHAFTAQQSPSPQHAPNPSLTACARGGGGSGGDSSGGSTRSSACACACGRSGGGSGSGSSTHGRRLRLLLGLREHADELAADLRQHGLDERHVVLVGAARPHVGVPVQHEHHAAPGQLRGAVALRQLVDGGQVLHAEVLRDGVLAQPLEPLEEVLVRRPQQLLRDVLRDLDVARVDALHHGAEHRQGDVGDLDVAGVLLPVPAVEHGPEGVAARE
mmetsp:Transcript_4179/g.13246  ORF Transcript_4179/g.13246 Transcript_4179/m.13246 type:complete len:258 (-) Transcript_4179:261-1034(-)